jgi:hypothetical protein
MAVISASGCSARNRRQIRRGAGGAPRSICSIQDLSASAGAHGQRRNRPPFLSACQPAGVSGGPRVDARALSDENASFRPGRREGGGRIENLCETPTPGPAPVPAEACGVEIRFKG